MIDVTCQCGRVSHSDEHHIGKHLRCPNCGEPVLIMDAARAMARPPETIPRIQSSQPRAKRLRRLRPLHTWTVLVSAVVTTALLVFHFQTRPNTKSAAPHSISDTGVASGAAAFDLSTLQPAPPPFDLSTLKPIQEASTNQGQAGGSQSSDGPDQATKWEVIDEEPIPPQPKSSPSSARSRQYSAGTNVTTVPQDSSPPDVEPSLPNGARIAPDVGIDGRGELNVNNGTAANAEVILYNIEKDEQTRDINVKAHSYFQITGIPVGTYELKYALGLSCYQFEHSLDYTEQRTEEEDRVRVNYKEISVTLHPVVGGNVRTKQIPRSEFLKGHRARRVQ
jgi:hypothetical protein